MAGPDLIALGRVLDGVQDDGGGEAQQAALMVREPLDVEDGVEDGVVDLETTGDGVLGAALEGHDVHGDAVADVLVDRVAVDEGGGQVDELHVGLVDVLLLGGAAEGVMLQIAHLIPDGIELFVVGPGHEHVDVVVPGDEALMPQGADQGAAADPVAEVVFPADFLEILEDLQGLFLEGMSPLCPLSGEFLS